MDLSLLEVFLQVDNHVEGGCFPQWESHVEQYGLLEWQYHLEGEFPLQESPHQLVVNLAVILERSGKS